VNAKLSDLDQLLRSTSKPFQIKHRSRRWDIDIYFGSFPLTALVPQVPKSLPQKRRRPSAIPGPNSLPFLSIFGRQLPLGLALDKTSFFPLALRH
jgi:hypothetical protein